MARPSVIAKVSWLKAMARLITAMGLLSVWHSDPAALLAAVEDTGDR